MYSVAVKDSLPPWGRGGPKQTTFASKTLVSSRTIPRSTSALPVNGKWQKAPNVSQLPGRSGAERLSEAGSGKEIYSEAEHLPETGRYGSLSPPQKRGDGRTGGGLRAGARTTYLNFWGRKDAQPCPPFILINPTLTRPNILSPKNSYSFPYIPPYCPIHPSLLEEKKSEG